MHDNQPQPAHPCSIATLTGTLSRVRNIRLDRYLYRTCVYIHVMWNMFSFVSQVCSSFCFSSQLIYTFTKKVNMSQNSSCSFLIACFCSFQKHMLLIFFLISPLLRFPDLPGDPLKYCNASAGCNESAYLQLLSRTSWCVGVMFCQKAVEILILQHGCVFGGKACGKHAKLKYIIVGMTWCKIVEPSWVSMCQGYLVWSQR